MDSRELYSIAREFLDKEFNLKLEIPIFVNNKMKKIFGRFRWRNGIAWQIDMSKEFMDTHPREHTIDVLKHELVHYALFELGKPHRDSDAYFKETVDRLGICRTRTYDIAGKFHKYTCNCGHTFYRKRRLSKGAHCSTCKTIKYVGEVIK